MTYSPYMRVHQFLLIGFILVIGAETVSAQAFCALRDPVRRVYEMFPEATSYRTVTSTVRPEHRQTLIQDLPFAHHFNEFGRHSLYVVMQDGKPLGLIHVRTERGRWGLVEICWALDFDLNILGFDFQRCRDPQCSSLREGPFEDLIVDSDFDTLRSALETGHVLESLPESQRVLGETVVRSGLKTIALTDNVWRNELIELRAPMHAEAVFGPDVVLEQKNDERESTEDVGFKMSIWGEWAISRADGEVMGKLIMTSISLPGLSDDLWWIIDIDGVLLSIVSQNGWPDDVTAKAFQQLVGRSITDFKDCATAAELAAEAVLTKQESP